LSRWHICISAKTKSISLKLPGNVKVLVELNQNTSNAFGL